MYSENLWKFQKNFETIFCGNNNIHNLRINIEPTVMEKWKKLKEKMQNSSMEK